MTSSSVDLTAMETAKEVAESAIDPDGDVVLVLEGAELQVSSKVLSVASAVFKAMFGPHFVEGSDLNGAGPRRVPLPEDDAGAMTILCNMLHHRSENVPTEPAPSDLEKLAVVCDKYDCTRVFAPWVRNWATYYQQTASKVVGINRLVHPFYVFDDEILFRQITVLVVTHTVGFISTPRTIGSLPAHVFETLQQRKWLAESQLCADLESVVNPIVKKKYRAGDAYVHDMFWLRTDDCVRLWGHLKILEERNLWPLTTAVKNRSIATVCDILSKYEHYELRNQNCGACPVCAIDFDKEVHSAAIHAMNSFEGLCLHCIKLGSNKDGEDNKCDFHTEKAVPDPGAR